MNVSASKLRNAFNHLKIDLIIKKNTNTSLFPMMFKWLNKTTNESDEVSRWVHQNYGKSLIINKLCEVKTKIALPLCCQRCSIEPKKQCMRVMNYKVDCIKLWNYLNHANTELSTIICMHLHRFYRQCSIELTKQWMRVIRLEEQCIKTTKWLE